MKKIYAALAVALTATPALAGKVNTVPAEQLNMTAEVSNLSEVAGTRGDAQKELNISSVADLLGVWMYSFDSGFDQDEHNCTLTFEQGPLANQVYIYGLMQRTNFYVGYPVVANVNIAERTITIPEQVVESDWSEEGPLKYIPFNAQTKAKTSGTVLRICPNGVQFSDGTPAYEDGCIATLGPDAGFFATDAGFAQMSGYAAFYNVIVTDPKQYGDESQQFFSFNPAEWEECGKATYTDGYMALADWWATDYLKVFQAPYEVNLLKKKGTWTEFIIVNPYGADTAWAEVNAASSKTGYIYINAENPNCVLVKPGVNPQYCDMLLWPMGPLYFCNNEGNLYYLNEYSIDEVLEELNFYGDPISTMVIKDNKATITLQNGLVANCCDLYNYGLFPIIDESISCGVSTLTFDATGVESVAADASNVAPRYFNLQGLEVENPAAGEVVIVKEGANSYKKVVR